MSAADLLEDGFPHGTVDGFLQGCRGSACPGDLEFGLSCRRAKQLDSGDWRYSRLVKQGLTPAEIARELGETPHEHPTPASRRTVVPEEDDEDVQVDDLDEEQIEGEDPIMTTTTTPTPATIIKSRKPEPQPAPEWPDEASESSDTSSQAVPEPEVATGELDLTPATIRAWARENGVPVNVKGSVRKDVVEAYMVAHGHITVEVATDTTSDDAPKASKPEFGPVSCALTPFIGARAWVRFDDGVAVVRDVTPSGNEVRVSWLPDPRDEEAWFTYLDNVTAWLPASGFSFDAFPEGSLTPGEVATVGIPAPIEEVGDPFDADTAPLNAEADGESDLPEQSNAADLAEALQHVVVHGPVADMETRAELFNEGWDEARKQSVEVTIESLSESLEFTLRQWAAAVDRARAAEERAEAAERELVDTRRPWWRRAS